MVRFLKGKTPVVQAELETQQERLRKLSGEVMQRYLKELNTEMNDPRRLKAVYGAGFADSRFRRQAELVATMATGMVKVPNAAINVVTADAQDSLALVTNHQVQDRQLHLPISESYCQHVIHSGQPMAVTDTAQHPLVCDTHLARDGVAVSYLGVPVADRQGIIVGTLCVFEKRQRIWSAADVGMLMQLSMVLTRALPSPVEISA